MAEQGLDFRTASGYWSKAHCGALLAAMLAVASAGSAPRAEEAVEAEPAPVDQAWAEGWQGEDRQLDQARFLRYEPSYNDFGGTGLLQMPNARLQPEGEAHLGASYVDPYIRSYFTLQILDRLEGTFRYTDVDNRLYSESRSFSGNQSYKDRGVDLKFVMLEESSHFPQIAVGLRDIGGTGLFGSEFLLASRRYYNWDFTLGIAWGNAGSRGHLPNPFGLLHDRAKHRKEQGKAGELGGDFFRGEKVALFGGVEYLPPVEGLRLKLEYDGNSYDQEPLGNRLETQLPINLGLEYELFPGWRIAAGFERGQQIMLRAGFGANLNRIAGPTKQNPKPPKPLARSRARELPPGGVPLDGGGRSPLRSGSLVEAVDRTILLERLFESFEEQGLLVSDLSFGAGEATLRLPVAGPRPDPEALTAAALKVARAELEGPVDRVRIVATREGRDAWEFVLETQRIQRSLALTGSPAALVEPPDPRWLGRFPEAIEPTGGREAAATAEPPETPDDLPETARRVFEALERQGFRGERFEMTGIRARIRFSQSRYRNPAKAIGRAARAVAAVAPPQVEVIEVVLSELGVPVSQTTLFRRDLEAAQTGNGSPEEIWQNAVLGPPEEIEPGDGVENPARYPSFTWAIQPKLRQQIGGPDDFFLYQLYGRASAQAEFRPGLSASAAVGKDLHNNFGKLKLESNSELPRVRSDIAKYLREGDLWIDRLHLDYIGQVSSEVYGRASIGIFELMFAGVGGELLYRPGGKRWAAGLDFNFVRQRDFDGLMGLQDYGILTGHVSYYHRLPWHEALATLRAGRYLAGDWGATLELAKTFDNGVSLGVFATKTNVSVDAFGEGAFDKGFFLSIPMDLFFTKPSRRQAGLTYRPTTRDGGQRLAIPRPLYGLTEHSAEGAVTRGWGQLLD